MAIVSEYLLKTAGGRPIRKATQVTLPSGFVIRFIDKLPKKDAIRQAKYHESKHNSSASMAAKQPCESDDQ